MAGRGRPVGALDREQRTLKQAILDAFGQLGGATWLVEQAKADPALFIPLLRALVPRQIDADLSHEGSIEIRWRGDAPAA